MSKTQIFKMSEVFDNDQSNLRSQIYIQNSCNLSQISDIQQCYLIEGNVSK